MRTPESAGARHGQLVKPWTLSRGDCLDPLTGLATLADDSVDVTITDPPYEAEAHEKGKRQSKVNGCGKEERGKPYVRVVDEEFDFKPMTEANRQAVGLQIARVTKKIALVFCQVEAAMLWRAALEAGGLVYRRTIPWVKPDAMPSLHGRWPGQAFESIVLALKPGATCPIGGKARYYETTKSRGVSRAHETAKPLSLMLQVAEDFTERGDVVLDCYAGSGTTGVAVIKHGCSFIGWELAGCARCDRPAEWDVKWTDGKGPHSAFLCEPHHTELGGLAVFKAHRDNMFDIARRRLMGDEAKPRPEQPSLFDNPAPRAVGRE